MKVDLVLNLSLTIVKSTVKYSKMQQRCDLNAKKFFSKIGTFTPLVAAVGVLRKSETFTVFG